MSQQEFQQTLTARLNTVAAQAMQTSTGAGRGVTACVTASNQLSEVHRLGFQGADLTAGIGTEAYSAPEQQQSSGYDNKADMFSIGVMLLELISVFKTETERAFRIRDLKQHKLPVQLMEALTVQCSWALRLVSEDPKKRMSAAELKESVEKLSLEDNNQSTPQLSRTSSLSDVTGQPDDDVRAALYRSDITIAHYENTLKETEGELHQHAKERYQLQQRVVDLELETAQLRKLLDEKDAMEAELRRSNQELQRRLKKQARKIAQLEQSTAVHR